MQPEPLRVHVGETAGHPVLRVTGDLDRSGAGELGDAFRELDHSSAVVLDFSRLTYMDSGGIGSLVELVRSAEHRGIQLRAAGLSSHFHKIFQITQLSDLIPVYADVATATAVAGP